MKRIQKKEGFASIVEVIVTAVIFVVAAAGILTTISMLRPQGEESSKKLEAAYIAKGVIEELRSKIDADTWKKAGGKFEPGIPYSEVRTTSTGEDIHIDYTFYLEPPLDLMKMVVTVTYPDP